MNSKKTLSYAIVAILTASAAGMARAEAPATEPSIGLEEITVTAQRRSENIQNVPITIQALTSETLKQLGVTTFDDMVKYLPNVSLPTNGPGQGNIFMRGLSVGSAGTQSSGSIGGFPNVAVYLDEQSGQLPARNLDIYAVDLERVEILEGPQGTLFGGGAQAGVVRYITNKPKINVTEGYAEAGYGVTAHGDPNTSMNATLNLPLIADKLAVRAVIYSDNRGGYINNVPSTFQRKNTDLGIYYANYAGGVPPDSVVINNNSIARNAINPVKYQGMRLQALYDINDDWNLLIAQSYQNMEADGVFYQTPKGANGQTLNPLEVNLFNDSYNKDRFENTAWTLNGKIGALKAVYTGGYMVRNVEQVSDYTNYARGVYADYYQCYGPGSGKYSAGHGYAIYGVGDPNLTSKCFSPSSTWHEAERNTHQSHEFRLSTPDDWRLRAIGGAFWEDYKIYDQTDWLYKSIPACTSNGAAGTPGNTGCESNVAPNPGATVQNPGTRNDNVGFGEDILREYKQTAFFASVDYDLIPKVLTATAGTRHYSYNVTEKGSQYESFGCFESGTAPCTYYGKNIDAENLGKTYSGFKSRANITWHVTPDTMLYATWSQGYRPGGFNRKGGSALTGTDGKPQFEKPLAYAPDTLVNTEFGWKTEWFDHRLQVNGSWYDEKWQNVQTALYNPGVFGNLTFGTNGPDYKVQGFELSTVARVTEGLTVQGSGSWNYKSEQTNSPYLINNNPASAGYGQQITEYVFRGAIKQISDTFGVVGGHTAYSPPFQFNLRARYDWNANDYKWFVQGGVSHVAHMYSQTQNYANGDTVPYINTTLLRYEMPGYSTFDGSFGFAKDNWTVQFIGSNLTNENASVFTSSAQFIKSEVPVRPRVLGVKMGFKF